MSVYSYMYIITKSVFIQHSQLTKTVNLAKISAWDVIQTGNGNGSTAVQRETLECKTHSNTFPTYKALRLKILGFKLFLSLSHYFLSYQNDHI